VGIINLPFLPWSDASGLGGTHQSWVGLAEVEKASMCMVTGAQSMEGREACG
jgi:hypothetical protein